MWQSSGEIQLEKVSDRTLISPFVSALPPTGTHAAILKEVDDRSLSELSLWRDANNRLEQENTNGLIWRKTRFYFLFNSIAKYRRANKQQSNTSYYV